MEILAKNENFGEQNSHVLAKFPFSTKIAIFHHSA